jgi:hypothetical protein
VTAVVLIRAALRHAGRAPIDVTGTSMLPTIRPGGRVTIVARPFAAVAPGDVVAFACGPDVFVHRVVDRDADRLVTIGDNMPLFDPPVTADGFLGCAEGIGGAPLTPSDGLGTATAADLAGTTVWCPRPPAGRAPAARLAALGATVRVADPDAIVAAVAGGGARIGVSGLGAGTARSIPALLAGGPGHLLVGYRFGRRGADGCVPPDAADHHVRTGAPLCEISLEDALNTIAGLFDRAGLVGTR